MRLLRRKGCGNLSLKILWMSTGGKEMVRSHEVGILISAGTALMGCATIACPWSHMILPIKQVIPLSTFLFMRICVKLHPNTPYHQEKKWGALSVQPSFPPYLPCHIV